MRFCALSFRHYRVINTGEAMKHTAGDTMQMPGMKECIAACNACADSCGQTLAHCLEKGGKHVEAKHISGLVDCAQICRTNSDFMGRGSQSQKRSCAVCAEVCRSCEASCRSFKDDEMMQQCADACRKCADSCEKMAA